MGIYQNRFRRKFFVDPVVQGAIVRRLILHWAYAMLAGLFCLLMLQVFTTGTSTSLGGQLSLFWERYGILLVAMHLTLPILIYDSIRLSHRFAGPMLAVRMALKRLAAGGKIPQITFRQGDFWSDIADDLNQVSRQMDEAGLLSTEVNVEHDKPSTVD